MCRHIWSRIFCDETQLYFSELKDQFKLEVTAFQLEANVPEIYKKGNANKKKQWEQPFYWKHLYALAGTEGKPVEEEYKHQNINEFWFDMADI